MDHPRLYVRPSHRIFGPGDENALRKELADLERATVVDEIDSITTLQMDETGALSGGYRFTSSALRQVCTLLGRGLYMLTTDIAGLNRDPDQPREEYSFRQAVALYNRLLALRAENRLVGRQRILRNHRDRLVEGTLGPKYTLVANTTIFARLSEIASERTPQCRFHEAVLTGRRLMLRYVDRKPLFEAANATFHGGIHFANSEVGGESAIRAASLLWNATYDCSAMGRYLGGRARHTGRDFARRLAEVFRKASAAEQDPKDLSRRMQLLQKIPLPVTAQDEENRIVQIKNLVLRLAEQQIPQRIGVQVIARAIRRSEPVRGWLPSQSPPSRTAYDLYLALCNEAKTLYATARENTEQVAHALLVGKFKLQQ